jgi:hypothetical protein
VVSRAGNSREPMKTGIRNIYRFQPHWCISDVPCWMHTLPSAGIEVYSQNSYPSSLPGSFSLPDAAPNPDVVPAAVSPAVG